MKARLCLLDLDDRRPAFRLASFAAWYEALHDKEPNLQVLNQRH
jgi:hypothetical protein